MFKSTVSGRNKWFLCLFLCLWSRASLIYINNCPMRCNTKQSIYYSASSLYVFRVSNTHIVRSTQNCNYSLWYWSYFLCSYLPSNVAKLTWPRWREVAALPEAVVTVLCTPNDGCFWHPKHVEWTCRIINRLLCVASHWTIINTETKVLNMNYMWPMDVHEDYNFYYNKQLILFSVKRRISSLVPTCNMWIRLLNR